MHDQYARRAALDSSPDDEQHELFTCRRTLRQRSHPVGYFEDKLQQEVLEYSAGTRSRTGRAGPRGAGKQARAQRTHRALAHGLAARRSLLINGLTTSWRPTKRTRTTTGALYSGRVRRQRFTLQWSRRPSFVLLCLLWLVGWRLRPYLRFHVYHATYNLGQRPRCPHATSLTRPAKAASPPPRPDLRFPMRHAT